MICSQTVQVAIRFLKVGEICEMFFCAQRVHSEQVNWFPHDIIYSYFASQCCLLLVECVLLRLPFLKMFIFSSLLQYSYFSRYSRWILWFWNFSAPTYYSLVFFTRFFFLGSTNFAINVDQFCSLCCCNQCFCSKQKVVANCHLHRE